MQRVKKEKAELKKVEKALVKQIEAMEPEEVEATLGQLDAVVSETTEPKRRKARVK